MVTLAFSSNENQEFIIRLVAMRSSVEFQNGFASWDIIFHNTATNM
jgi:hypothetical protein